MMASLRTTRPGGYSPVRLRGVAALVISAATLIALTVLLVPRTAMASSENPDAEHYVSTVTAIDPAVTGLEVTVHGSGESVTLTNHTGRTVIVRGYSGEDYLRFTSTGVSVNRTSITAALNADGGRSGPPPGLTGKPVSWRPISTASTFTWSDFRIRWTGDERPPIVTADPHARHQVFAWAIQLKVGSQPTLVRGDVTWTGTSWLSRSVLLITAGLLALVVALILAIRARRRRVRRLAARVIPLARPAGRTVHSSGVR